MKTSFIARLCAIIISLFFAGAVAAQSYIPLAPLPGIDYGKAGENPTAAFAGYLSSLVTFAIAIAGALAVIMIIIGGTQYVASGITPDAKGDAKDRITNAFIGLALTLTSYLILNSINPDLLKFNLVLDPVALTEKQVAVEVVEEGAWGDDYTTRSRLITGGSGKLIITPPGKSCAEIGETGCTSVFGLGETAISGLIDLANNCTGCEVAVTGGTEYWRHGNKSTDRNLNKTQHKPGGNVVDLSLNDTKLNNYIRTKGTLLKDSAACSTGTHYQIGNAMYVDEDIPGNPGHWHVCYGYSAQ